MSGNYDPNDMNAVVSALHTKLDVLRQGQLENGVKLDNALHRISALEAWKVWIYGMAAGISALVAIIGGGLKLLLVKLTGGSQ